MSHRQKALALRIKAAAAVDDATLAAINQHTLRPFAADELQVREYVLAHNCIDRDNEVFDEPLLDAFASSLPGKGVHIRHPQGWDGDTGPGEGKVFAARTEVMSLDDLRTLTGEPTLQLPPDRTQAKVLFASAYFARTPDNAGLLIKADAGIAGDVSIGFSAQAPEPIKDAQGNTLTAKRWKAPGQAYEMSLVWLGAQPGARAVKSAKTPTDPEPPTEPTMTEEEIAALQGSLKTAQTNLAEAQKEAAVMTALKTALGTDAVVLNDAAGLKVIIADAKAYKAALIDDAITLERQLGITGDDETVVNDAKGFLADWPVARLQAHVKGLEKRLPNHAQLKAANPNNPQAPGDGSKPEADSIAANPALA